MRDAGRASRPAAVAGAIVLAALVLFARGGRPARAPDTRPSLVLVSIDSLRADHVGAHGYARPTTPHLDALARSGLDFRQAVAPACWTTPSHLSLLTSLLPTTHGVRMADGELGTGVDLPALRPTHLTLAEHLRRAGYATAAFTGGGPLSGRLGFERGFDVYDEDLARLSVQAAARVGRFLSEQRAAGRPFFLFLHTFEVHSPYTGDAFVEPEEDEHPPAVAATAEARRDAAVARYDGDIVVTDGFLGALVDELRKPGHAGRTVVAVTSDHGQEFAERDPSSFIGAHGHSLYDEILRVPLVVARPGDATFPRRDVEAQVSLLDVAPTLVELLGLPPMPGARGRSLVPLALGRDQEPMPAIAECVFEALDLRSFRDAGWKYVQGVPRRPALAVDLADLEAPVTEHLFDLRTDPGERVDLCRARPAECAEHRRRLAAAVKASLPPDGMAPRTELPPDVRERLRALGYVR